MTQPNIEHLKNDFQKKKSSYLAKEKKLNSLNAEKRKAEDTKQALKAELEELSESLKNKVQHIGKYLTADEFAEMKTANFNIKAKIDYYQAVIEEVEANIYEYKV